MDKKVVRASYEGCLDAAARLSAFATSKPFLGATEVNERQDLMAADDLIVFCIHARRLIENLGLKDLLGQVLIRATDDTMLSLWKVMGYLIHHDLLEIFRCQTRLRMLLTGIHSTGDEFWEKIRPELHKRPYSEPMDPHVLFKSDQIKSKMISLTEFMQIFSTKIMPVIIKKALDADLVLVDDSLADLDPSEVMSRYMKI